MIKYYKVGKRYFSDFCPYSKFVIESIKKCDGNRGHYWQYCKRCEGAIKFKNYNKVSYCGTFESDGTPFFLKFDIIKKLIKNNINLNQIIK